MSEVNKALLNRANAAISDGNYEGFLACCADDSTWTFVGEQTLVGKDAVRQWMALTYREPPAFEVTHLIAEGEVVVAIGTITTKDVGGTATLSSYCDVWRVRGGQPAALRAFVIAPAAGDDANSAP